MIFTSSLLSNPINKVNIKNIKDIIQMEEYVALAVNKYILQTGKLPINNIVTDRSFNWNILTVDEYLGSAFNHTGIVVKFDTSNNLFISGAVPSANDFDENRRYLYNFYINRMFRVNTIPPESINETDLINGSQILYTDIVKDIVTVITDDEEIRIDSEACPTNDYFYEIKNEKLTYKFCRGDYSFDVYQRPPILLETQDDLKYIKAKIGDRVYAQKNGNWYEYYYQGDLDVSWVPVESGSVLHSQDEDEDVEDRIISYIPDSKDLALRDDGGCMLANGDIFCWGNNFNKKAGIETNGQLNPNFSPDFINTPVMLKVQIDDTVSISGQTRKDKKWYNNPYRIKFEKMAFNSRNVCGISPIFDYFQSGVYKKFGGDIFCNGKLNSQFFADIDDVNNIDVTTSILKKNKFFAQFKSDETYDDEGEVYLTDVAMVEGVVAVLSESGQIYTLGINNSGALGINNSDETFFSNTPTSINQPDQVFKELYALRNIKSFAALDEYNKLWIWGERPNGNKFYKPTLEEAGRSYDSSRVFVNSKELILRGLDKNFYKTEDTSSSVTTVDISSSVPSTALSASVYKVGSENRYLYIDKERKLQGTESLRTCRWITDSLCGNASNRTLFNLALGSLNGSSSEDGDFSNVSIFQINNIVNQVYEDFESTVSGWSNNSVHSGGTVATKFLGRFGKNIINNNGSEQVFKTFDFGSSNANKQVTISFDMYEIGSWDADKYSGDGGITEALTVYLNGVLVAQDTYKGDNGTDLDDRYGIPVTINSVGSSNNEKHIYNFASTLDTNGRMRVGFGALLGEDYTNESFGIDNLKITVNDPTKHFVCTMTGLGTSSQMYCWGNPGRSLPILSTSLYDVSKIDNLNKFFITQNNEVTNQMTNNEFNNKGKLYLKFPTYIGGFDYEFYFK